jgi:hypothetical protein
MSVFGVLAIILLMAALVESLTEYLFGTLADHVPTMTPYKWALIYVAAIIGVAGAWVYKFDLFYLLSNYLAVPIALTWYGVTMTGLVIGRGANFLHDLVSKYFKPLPEPQAGPTE